MGMKNILLKISITSLYTVGIIYTVLCFSYKCRIKKLIDKEVQTDVKTDVQTGVQTDNKYEIKINKMIQCNLEIDRLVELNILEEVYNDSNYRWLYIK